MSPATMVRHRVCAESEIAEAGMRVHRTIEGIDLAVFRLSDGLFALENRCAHQGGPVCRGATFRFLTAEVMPDGRTREYYASEEHDVIACPWHGWEHDIRTGRVLADRRRGARTFPVDVVDGDVYVSILKKD